MKQRMKEEGHRIRLRMLLDFLPDCIDRYEAERLYFSPGLKSNELFVQYLESKLDEHNRDRKLQIYIDSKRQSERMEEIEEFKNMSIK